MKTTYAIPSIILALLAGFFLGRSTVRNPSVSVAGNHGSDPSNDDRVAVIRKYLETNRWEDRLPFVRNPGQVKPLMAKSYKDFRKYNGHSIDPSGIKQASSLYPELECFIYRVVTPATSTSPEFDMSYFVIKTRDGWKVDWEATQFYNPVSLLEFRNDPKYGTYPFRVRCKLSNYFNVQYADSESSHFAFDLQDKSEGSLTGYAKRSAPFARLMFEELKKGGESYVILMCRHTLESDVPGYSGKPDRSLVEITGLVSDLLVSPPFND
jgi:hypothetical protein